MEKEFRVLILEDNPSDFELMEDEMREAGLVYKAKRVMTEQEYLHEIQAFKPEIILSDYDLPRYNGLLALTAAKARCPEVPFILVTGVLEEGRAIEAIHPPEAMPKVLEAFELCMRGGQRIAEAVPVMRRGGSVFHADICASAVTIGTKQCAVGLFRDITDRLKVEEALRKSEKFIKDILDTVDEGFIVIDKNFCILTANRAYCQAVGEKREDVVGRHCYALSHGVAAPCYEAGEECPVQRVFLTGESSSALHTHIDSKGGVSYVEVKAFPLKDDGGVTVAAIETVNNVTAKRLLEEERLQTEKMAAIGTLAGGIAHDFNNLLQGVFGYITMAKMDLEQQERPLAMLEQSEKALHLAVSLTDQLLTFAKGGKPLKNRMDLRDIIEDAVKFALSGSRVAHRIIAAEDLRPVEADAGQIGR